MTDYGSLIVKELTASQAQEEIGVKTLAAWREFLSKSNGTVPGPKGSRFPVSLEKWKDAPADTLIKIAVRWVDPDLVGTYDTSPPKQ